jgi:acyl-CoA-dependent ceramide synthase
MSETLAASSFKILIVPIILYVGWKILNPHEDNPFEPFLFISHRVPQSPDADPRYAKGWKDLLFIAYHIVVFSFVRQFIILKLAIPIAWRFGIKKRAKLDRFGEQGYCVLYHGVMGFWGLVSSTFRHTECPFLGYVTEHYENPSDMVVPHRILLDW